jgi:hypothetical protein
MEGSKKIQERECLMMIYTVAQSITALKGGYAKELQIAEPSKLANPKFD